jgi:hypothetical protein
MMVGYMRAACLTVGLVAVLVTSRAAIAEPNAQAYVSPNEAMSAVHFPYSENTLGCSWSVQSNQWMFPQVGAEGSMVNFSAAGEGGTAEGMMIVPEPSALLSMVCGVMGLLGFIYKRR